MEPVVAASAPRPAAVPLRGRQSPGPGTWLLIALLLGLALAVQFGAVPVAFSDWWAPLASLGGNAAADTRTGGAHLTGSAYVLWDVRLPRAMLAVLVGASLGLAGALAQGLFRNPMADPGLLGVTAGAACAAALVLTVFASLHMAVPPAWRVWVLPASAFGGALVVCFGLDRLARWLTPGSVAGLLLTGLALQALTMAIVGLCTTVATDEQLRSLTFWTLGSLAGASWLTVGVTAAALACVTLRLPALAVAWCGVIGFIGLMAPHLVRTLVGADQRRVLPLSMGTGALLLLAADTAARTAAIPAEIPVGIFTALIGAPAFLAMLRGAARSRGNAV
jgi:iron complex transport system permease protein